jgi:hypothetical protein
MPAPLTKLKKKHHQSGLLYSGDIELDALRNYLRVNVLCIVVLSSLSLFIINFIILISLPVLNVDEDFRPSSIPRTNAPTAPHHSFVALTMSLAFFLLGIFHLF